MKKVKKRHSLRKYQHWIMGFLWIGFGLFYVLDDNPLTFLIYGYIFLGIAEIILQLYYKKKGRAEESIGWDEEEIIVQKYFQKPDVFRVEETEFVTVTRNKFLIRSDSAKGVMLDLKGFSEEDLKLLKARFSAEPNLSQV